MENPLRVGLPRNRAPQPCAIVIFGATGDLTHRKLIPAIYRLVREGLLPASCAVVGFARSPGSNESLRESLGEALDLAPGDAVWEQFAQNIFYHRSDYANPAGYQGLGELLARLDRERGTGGNRLYYLATPPGVAAQVAQRLGEAGPVPPPAGNGARGGSPHSAPSGPWARLVVEKPFGHDLASAADLNRRLAAVFAESQIFRIDHYLGKETVQNLLVLRFANGLFEPVWNARHVDHVQITVSESLGVEGRGGYFEGAGILRDMVQNHLLQLLCLVGMEPPAVLEADAIRDEKVQLLRSLRPIRPEDVPGMSARGQYREGWVDGEEVPAYRAEPDVAPDSRTETYAALRLWIDNWRWAGVPFYLRAGKRLPKRVTEIAVQFNEVPRILFNRDPETPLAPNVLVIRIQPDEGISLRFSAKAPGPAVQIQPVKMEFSYGAAFGQEPPEAYERLLLDAMLGDSTLFTRRDEVEAAWAVVDPIRAGWELEKAHELPTYAAGTWGPEEADAFIRADGREWRRL
jgi:glucose-6-phosphate 1-dehydrogenase